MRDTQFRPPIAIDRYAPTLTGPQVIQLRAQWARFWAAPSVERQPPSEALIPAGALIHNAVFDAGTFRSIMGSGILSGEVRQSGPTIPEDSETHYCADFFVNRISRSVADWTAYVNESVSPAGSRLRLHRMERFVSPNDRNANISFVVDPAQPEVAALTAQPATAKTLRDSPLAGWPIRFPREAESPDADNHRAVLVGVPARAISKIICGGVIARSPSLLGTLKAALREVGLDIPICDTNGKLVREVQQRGQRPQQTTVLSRSGRGDCLS